MMPEILHLNLRRMYFDDIVEGRKRVEYRDRSPYWRRRLEGRRYDAIHFRNGYATKAPEMLVEFRGIRRFGAGRRAQYAISLGRVIKLKRWRKKQKRH